MRVLLVAVHGDVLVRRLGLGLWAATVIALSLLAMNEAEWQFAGLMYRLGLRDTPPMWCASAARRDFEASLCIRMRWPDDMSPDEWRERVEILEDRGYRYQGAAWPEPSWAVAERRQ